MRRWVGTGSCVCLAKVESDQRSAIFVGPEIDLQLPRLRGRGLVGLRGRTEFRWPAPGFRVLDRVVSGLVLLFIQYMLSYYTIPYHSNSFAVAINLEERILTVRCPDHL